MEGAFGLWYGRAVWVEHATRCPWNGGRLFLPCPAWVWKHYDKKPIDDLPYARIAKHFGLIMDTQYVKPPLKFVHPNFSVDYPDDIL